VLNLTQRNPPETRLKFAPAGAPLFRNAVWLVTCGTSDVYSVISWTPLDAQALSNPYALWA
jgi:hypothetical protein